jgi:hypothetical protein
MKKAWILLLVFLAKSALSFPPPSSDPDLSIVTDDLGNQIAVWTENDRILVSELSENGNWSMPTPLSSPMAIASSPQIELSPAGDAVILWIEENGIKAVSKPKGGEWSPSQIAPIAKAKQKSAAIDEISKASMDPFGNVSLQKPSPFALSSPAKKNKSPASKESAEAPEVFQFSVSPYYKPLFKPDPSIAFDESKLSHPSAQKDSLPLIDSDPLSMSVNAIDAPSGGTLTGGQIGFAAGTSAPTGGLVVSGQTGIGTSSPSTKLHVFDASSAALGDVGSILLSGTLTSGGASPRIAIGINYSASVMNYGWIQVVENGVANRPLALQANGSGVVVGSTTTPGSIVDISGNLTVGASYVGTAAPSNGAIIQGSVGIGTSSPSTKLHVFDASSVPTGELGSILISGTVTTGPSTPRLAMGISYSASTMNYGWIQAVENGIAQRYLSLQGEGGSSSNVVIGAVTSPGSRTDISGNLTVGASYVGTAAPTNGAIIQGQSGIGTSSPSSTAYIEANGSITNAGAKNLYVNGIMNCNGTGGGFGAMIYISGSINVNGSGSNNAFGLYSNPTVNATTTIGNFYAIYAESTLGTGTITNAYGVYAKNPSSGTNKVALYADNAAIGFTGVAPPSNGLIVQGNSGFGLSAASSNSTISVAVSSTDTTAINITGTGPTNSNTAILFFGESQNFTSNTGFAQEIEFDSTINVATGITLSNYFAARATMSGSTGTGTISNAYMYSVMGIGAGSGTTTNFYGFHYDGSHLGATITNAYGGYFALPTAGTNAHALHADNASIGSSYTGTSKPPTDGAIIQGQVGIGTSSPTANTKVDVAGSVSGSSGNVVGTLHETGATASGTATAVQCAVTGTLTAASGLSAYGILSQPTFTTTANSQVASVYIPAASGSGSTITAYGIYVQQPTIGTTNAAIRADSMLLGTGAINCPSGTAIFNGPVLVATTTNTSGVIQAGGSIDPASNKNFNVGQPTLRWNVVNCVSTSTGTSRLAPSRTLCKDCQTTMMRGTGTSYTLGEEADYIAVFCLDCGAQKIEAIAHLPSDKLAQKKPAPEIKFLGFRVTQQSGNSRSIQVLFSYGDIHNSTLFSDVEYEQFLAMDTATQRAALKDLGQREWDALEEVRLMKETCDELQASLDNIAAPWVGTDLLQDD